MTRDLHRIVDEQIKKWRLERELDHRAVDRERVVPARGPSHAVTIAHPIGADGRSIGARVGELLGLPTYDRDILAHIATSEKIQVSTVETLDETSRGRMESYIASLLTERAFDTADYLRALSRTVLALWEHGPCVLVGHGVVHIVPRSHALAVRLTAPLELRIERVARTGQLALDEARRRVRASDAEREAFHMRYFGVSVHDPLLYDLVLNTAELEAETCARLIVNAYQTELAPS